MIRKAFRRLLKLMWLLPGIVLWASYPPVGERMDVLFALAPLMWLTRRGDARRSALVWLCNGMLFWIGTLQWMPAIVSNGGPWPLVLLGWGLLGGYCALYFGAYGWLAAKAWRWASHGGYWRRLAAILFAEPVLWAGLELVRSRLFGGFAWNHLGTPAAVAGFGAPASLGGIYLVSALVLLVNGTFASIAERMVANILPPMRSAAKVPKFLRSAETLLPLAIVWLCFQCASSASVSRDARDSGDTGETRRDALTVALVQRNSPCVFKGRSEDPFSVYGNLLSNMSMLRPDLVVLAESATSEIGMSAQSPFVERFASWIREISTSRGVLAGGVRIDGEGREYNSAVLYTAGGTEAYDKTHLVPFGEFIPGDKTFPSLQRYAPVGSCWPGKLKTLDFGGIPLGVAICFEDTDAAQVRQLARLGARVLFFITNDAWFSHSAEAEQHAWQSVARAIETGLPVVRVGNSGVTGTIAPDGKATWLRGPDGRVAVDRQGVMVERLDVPATSPTAYSIVGDAPLAVLFVLALAALAACEFYSFAATRRAKLW